MFHRDIFKPGRLSDKRGFKAEKKIIIKIKYPKREKKGIIRYNEFSTESNTF